MALHSAENRQSCSRRNRCWQNGIDIARCRLRVIHAAGKRRELAVRHADLQREATAVMANGAPALLYDIAVWYLVWVCGRVCAMWWDEQLWWDEQRDGFKKQ